MNDALVHEWLDGRLGSERVFEALAAAMPEAELFALDATPGNGLQLGGRQVTTTMLDRPLFRRRRALALPAMPLAWRGMARGRSFGTVVVSHHSFATQFARHCRADRRMAYVHAPARYVWTPELDGRGGSPLLVPARWALRRTDLAAVRSLDAIAANSREVATRLERHWGREATVIHPPVDVDYFTPSTVESSRDYVLGVSRFISYKRLDRVIEAGEAAGLPVVIAGSGPGEAELRERAAAASVPVTFEIRPDDERLRELYRHAACLVFLAHEDFGIVPVEAQACGTPVVGLAVGGTAETVLDGVTGVQVAGTDAGASLGEAVRRAAGLDPEACRRWAEGFSYARFSAEMTAWLATAGP